MFGEQPKVCDDHNRLSMQEWSEDKKTGLRGGRAQSFVFVFKYTFSRDAVDGWKG